MTDSLKAALADHKPVLSTLWVVMVLNYLYCDVLGLHDPAYLNAALTGSIGGIDFTPEFLLAAGLLMQIPIAMVLLSRVLPRRENRLANIVAALFMAAVQVSTLFIGSAPTSYYLFFSAVEVGLLLFILGYAWTWKKTAPALTTERVEQRA